MKQKKGKWSSLPSDWGGRARLLSSLSMGFVWAALQQCSALIGWPRGMMVTQAASDWPNTKFGECFAHSCKFFYKLLSLLS